MSDNDDSYWKTRQSLLIKVSNQDNKESWEEFLKFYKQYIYGILRSTGINPHDAEELNQNILLKLWNKMPEFSLNKDRGSFRKWLNTVIRNENRDYYRKTNRRKTILDDNKDQVTTKLHDLDSEIEINKIITREWENHITSMAWEHIKTKFSQQIQDIYLQSMENKSTKEIAKETGLAENTVNSYKRRITNSLKEHMTAINNEFV